MPTAVDKVSIEEHDHDWIYEGTLRRQSALHF